MPNMLKQLTKESLVYGLSAVATRFINIVMIPLYTRVFSPEDYGVMSLVITTMTIVSVLVIMALDAAAGRWYWDTSEQVEQKSTIASWVWCQTIGSIAIGSLILIFSRDLAVHIIGREDAAEYIQWSVLALPFTGLGFIVTNWLRFQRRPWSTLVFTATTSILTIGITILFVLGFQWGLKGVFMAQFVASLGTATLAIFFMRDWMNPIYFRWQRLREMLKFALPLIPAGLMYWVISSSDRYFIRTYVSVHEVGIYQLGVSIAVIVAFGTSAFQQAWGPFAMSIHKEESARQTYTQVFLFYLWSMCFLSVAVTIFSPEIIRIFATHQYEGAGKVVGLLTLSYVMMGLTAIAATGPTIVKSSTSIGVAIIVAALVTIGLNFILVPRFGILGSAIAAFASQALVPCFLFYWSQRIYPIPYAFFKGFILVALAGVLIVIGSLLQFENILLKVAINITLLFMFVPFLFMFRITTVAGLLNAVGIQKNGASRAK